MLRICLACLLALTFLPPQPLFAAHHLPSAREEEIKAAFLYNFTKFVVWPERAFTSSSSPFKSCLFADHTNESVFAAFHDKQILGRSVEVISVGNLQDIDTCQLLYIGNSDRDSRAKVLAAVNGKPILTIGENSGFAEQGGMINFYIVEDRVRFEMNLEVINQAGLTASSRLLNLARIVKESN